MSVGARDGSMAQLVEREFRRIRPGVSLFELPAFYGASMRALRVQMGNRWPRKKALQELELVKVLRSMNGETL